MSFSYQIHLADMPIGSFRDNAECIEITKKDYQNFGLIDAELAIKHLISSNEDEIKHHQDSLLEGLEVLFNRGFLVVYLWFTPVKGVKP